MPYNSMKIISIKNSYLKCLLQIIIIVNYQKPYNCYALLAELKIC